MLQLRIYAKPKYDYDSMPHPYSKAYFINYLQDFRVALKLAKRFPVRLESRYAAKETTITMTKRVAPKLTNVSRSAAVLATGLNAMPRVATGKSKREFDPATFLATIGAGRKIIVVPRKQTIFTQGNPADSVLYIQKGKVRLTVVSKAGKEATIGILGEGNFFGEGSLAGQALRMGSAIAITDCELLRIEKKAMMDALHREHAFSDLFVAYLLGRNIRYEEDLVDQLFNSSEKRLARVLLMLAHFGKEGVPETVIPKISQETLAEMIGTTRSRVSFFMNRFRKLGFIHYNGGLQVHSSLLNIVLHD
jgi:CRP/FNR family transcriptional regulator, cyclic AMP receptor protein